MYGVTVLRNRGDKGIFKWCPSIGKYLGSESHSCQLTEEQMKEVVVTGEILYMPNRFILLFNQLIEPELARYKLDDLGKHELS